jgi:hypothetical protein
VNVLRKDNFSFEFFPILSKYSLYFISYCLVCKSSHPFLVLKGVTEMSFLVLKRISGNSEEDQYFILSNCRLVIELQFGNIEY